MKKTLLLVALAAAGALSSTSGGRSAGGSMLHSSLDWLARSSGPALRPLVDPILAWSVRNELRILERDLRSREASFQPLPHPLAFTHYIQENHLTARGGRDPWGADYYLRITPDSVIVGSPGPDGVRGSPEDLRLSWLRHSAPARTRRN